MSSCLSSTASGSRETFQGRRSWSRRSSGTSAPPSSSGDASAGSSSPCRLRGRSTQLVEQGAGRVRHYHVALLFEEGEGLLENPTSLIRPLREPEHLDEPHSHVRLVVHLVDAVDQGDRLSREPLGLVELSSPRQYFCLGATPQRLGVVVVARRGIAADTDRRLGLGEAVLCVERLCVKGGHSG